MIILIVLVLGVSLGEVRATKQSCPEAKQLFERCLNRGESPSQFQNHYLILAETLSYLILFLLDLLQFSKF